MATKRTSSDFENSPIQSKQARIEGERHPFDLAVTPSVAADTTNIPPISKSVRCKVVKNFRAKLAAIKLSHEILLKEKFFLENGGNLMDFLVWKKKPNVLRDQFLKQHEIDGVQDLSDVGASIDPVSMINSQKQHNLPSSTTIQIPLSTVSPTLHATPPKGNTPLSPGRSIALPSSSPRPATRAHSSFSSVYENSHEDIVMRARHEAEVMKSIGELRKEGLWSASRLPKVQEPARIKTHWDYLLEEMQWLATDFNNEKRWKINAARKVMSIKDLLSHVTSMYFCS